VPAAVNWSVVDLMVSAAVAMGLSCRQVKGDERELFCTCVVPCCIAARKLFVRRKITSQQRHSP
jgi:hypothetical protein